MGGGRYRVNCLPGPREPFKRDTLYLTSEATEGAGGVLVSRNLTLSSTPQWAGGVIFDDYPFWHNIT